jgi:hypothetical protein
MIDYLGSRKLKISETKESVISFIQIIPEVQTKEYINHHILLADVSGSMSGSIRTLKERIKTTLEALLQIPNSYVSVISYSGHNESKSIINAVKCDQMSFAMSKVFETLEKELYIKSVTVMSEPLEKSIEICKSLAGICDKHHIALFTDGCLVPWNWSESVEEEKCFKVTEICNKQGIFLNAIGFGMYYDRKFLKRLIDTAGNGSLSHIDEIKDYADTILNIIKKVNAADVMSTNVISIEGAKLFNLSNSLMNSSLTLTGKDNIFAVFEGSSLIVDDENFTISVKKDITDNLVEDFYYSLSRYYLQEEDVDNYEYILGLLGDVGLFNITQNCYSFIEKGNAVNEVTKAYEDNSKRYLKGKKIFAVDAASEPLCVLEILQSIMEDSESELYWDLNTPYHKITQATKNIEDNIKFTRQESGLVPVSSIDIGSDKLNIGIKVSIPGMTEDEICKLKKESCIFRAYNIINGGNVNVPYLNCKLSKSLFDKLNPEGVVVQNGLYSYVKDNVYTINLKGIKSTNKRVLKSMTMNEITENLKTIADLKCKQWALKQLINDVIGDKEKVEFSNLSIEEIEIRKLLRIDEYGIYKPLSTEKDNDSPFEIYPAIHMSWDIKFSDKKVKEKHLKDITAMFPKISVGDTNIFNKLTEMLNDTKKDMRNREFKVNCVRIASAIMNKSPFIWDIEKEKPKTTNDKILVRNMIVGGKVTQNEKILKINGNDELVQQSKWVQLIKCN